MLSDVHGQDRALVFLKRFSDRSIVNPLLLVGEDGVGRRFAAIQATKEIFCTGTRTSGCTCFDCSQIDQQIHPDLRVVVPVAEKDIGVDAMREVIEDAMAYPALAPLRVFVIDGLDRMTSAASNALLKTLEEPPATTRFLLLAEQANRVIPTIRSRCGKVPFGRLPESVILAEIQKFEPDHTKALVYARIADGSLGRAVRYWGAGRLRLRDQVLTLLEHGLVGDLSSLFSTVDTIASDLSLALRFLEQLLHDILMVPHAPERIVNVDIAENLRTFGSNPTLTTAVPRLLVGTRVVRDRMRSARINAAFHVKSIFVDSFVGA